MKSERVTQAWEFYRDNCQGYKEPMRREFRKLDEHVSSVEAENAKLRELVQDYDRVLSSMHALCDCDFVPLNDATLLALRSRMHELGIEVDK